MELPYGPQLPPKVENNPDVMVYMFKGDAGNVLGNSTAISPKLKIVTVDSISYLRIKKLDVSLVVNYGNKSIKDLDILVYSKDGSPIPRGDVLLDITRSSHTVREYNLIYNYDRQKRGTTEKDLGDLRKRERLNDSDDTEHRYAYKKNRSEEDESFRCCIKQRIKKLYADVDSLYTEIDNLRTILGE